MTTTEVLANMPASAVDVAVKRLDQTKLIARPGFKGKAAVNSSSAEYIYNDGDPDVETVVRVNINRNPDTGLWQQSIRLATVRVRTVDDVVQAPEVIEGVISWNQTGSIIDLGKLRDFLGTLYSLTFDDLATKVPTTALVSAVNRGAVDGLYG